MTLKVIFSAFPLESVAVIITECPPSSAELAAWKLTVAPESLLFVNETVRPEISAELCIHVKPLGEPLTEIFTV